MARQRYDIASKWLLGHQGKGALLLGGLRDVRRYQPMPGEISQSRKFPDALLQVFLGRETKPHHVLIEVATYPERRALRQALDDLTLSYNALGHLPELVMLILSPKGRFRIEGKYEVRSRLGTARLTGEWKPVEVWTLSAEEYLAEGDVGVVPWVPLMRFDGPPEALLERCRDKIERDAHPKDQADLLAVAQVLTKLKFPDPELLSLLGGRKAMIESPLLQQMMAERSHEHILEVLKARFGTVPKDVTKFLRDVLKEKKLMKLNVLAATSPDLEAFREALLS